MFNVRVSVKNRLLLVATLAERNLRRIVLLSLGLYLAAVFLWPEQISEEEQKMEDLISDLERWMPKVPFHYLAQYGGNRSVYLKT